MEILELIRQPWPWYVSGVLIGLTVPALFLLGNKAFGISSSLRHICAACLPGKIPYFHYDWKKEVWNLFFVAGVLLGAAVSTYFLAGPTDSQISNQTMQDIAALGISIDQKMMPETIFSMASLFTGRGFLFIVVGGFFVGFGTRYAGGCTSGHSIMGISTLQWPSLLATMSFMAGGFAMVHLILPLLLKII